MRVRKHRAPKGALRPAIIKPRTPQIMPVREHRAPNGALRRHRVEGCRDRRSHARKHRAPKGALRPPYLDVFDVLVKAGRKAPSVTGRIATGPRTSCRARPRFVSAGIHHPESVRLPTPTSADGPRRRTRSACRRSSARPSPWPPSASGSTNGHRP